MMMKYLHILICACLTTLLSFSAFAADGVTLVLKEGATIKLSDGYKPIVDAVKGGKLDGIIEVNLGGNFFYLRLSEIVAICRDDCPNMKVSIPKRD